MKTNCKDKHTCLQDGVGEGRHGCKVARVTSKPSEAEPLKVWEMIVKQQEKGASDRSLWRPDRHAVPACAFTEYLLNACCLPEVVPGSGNSNEESDQGFP